MNPKRREFLIATSCLAGAGIAPAVAQDQNAALRWAVISPGSFTSFIMDYMVKKGIDRKYALTLAKPMVYTSVTTYYNDFIVGNYDMCMGGWDTFAARHIAGVPLKFVCSFTTGNMINILVPKNGAKTLKELQGKTLAATQATGTYRMTRALIKELSGMDIESAMQVQNIDNPAAALTLVMTDRADAVNSWEPNTSAGLVLDADLRVLFNAGDEYKKKTGLELPYFGVALRAEVAARQPDLSARLALAFAESTAGIIANVEDALRTVGDRAGVATDTMRLAIVSNRLQFKSLSMKDASGRQAVKAAADMLVRNGALPKPIDDNFFA